MAESGEPAIYKWTDEDTKDLIQWRVANAHLFTGKRNAAVRGFEAFVLEKKLPKAISPLYVKKKWENLKQKYKELKCPPTGVSTEGGVATAASWKWYAAMDEAIGGRPSISPPTLIASSGQGAAVEPLPSVKEPLAKKRRGNLMEYLRELEERENEREREAEERDERRQREAEEREERRWREAEEREERRWRG
ncbi:uncharacterized protein LOC143485834 isoform X1 [Brachyhypopomus gauderio]|uniref:uncharacterized protein LOC143485834 isoform X1 n=1 Tax=Brachyhypopomus gauderio TaxID=698409 RepID=UPI0040410272